MFSATTICRARDMNYDGFQIETFEAGRGLWHARIRRADYEPVINSNLGQETTAVNVILTTPSQEPALRFRW
jgi:hypothetical protein